MVSRECIREMGASNKQKLNWIFNQSTGPLLLLLLQSKQDLGQGTRNKIKQQTFFTVLEQVHKKSNVFDFKAGGKYTCFPEIRNDLYAGVNVPRLRRWICRHRKKWHRQNQPFYKFCIHLVNMKSWNLTNATTSIVVTEFKDYWAICTILCEFPCKKNKWSRVRVLPKKLRITSH